MNATGSNTTPLGLLAMLGQNPDGGLSALMTPQDGEGGFSSMLTELMTPLPPATEGEGTLSLLQGLPAEDQGLPLLPLSETELITTELMPETLLPAEGEGAEVQDLLGQIRQSQQPLPVKPQLTQEELSEDASEVSVLFDSEDDDNTELVDGAVPLAVSSVVPQAAAQAVASTNEPVPMQRNRLALETERLAKQVTSAGPESATASELTEAGVTEAGDAEAGSDFYLPEEQLRPTASSLAGQTLSALSSQPSTSTPGQPLFMSASAAVSAETVEFSSDDINAIEESASLDETLAEAEQIQLRKEKLEFGQDRREWGGALGARILTMVAEDVQEARIQLDPPELGSLEVKLKVSQEQATVHVQAQNPQVREVLEASAHRLRDALAGQGISLDSFDVSDQSMSSGSGNGEPGDESQDAPSEWMIVDGDDDFPTERQSDVSSHTLLDTFA